VGAQGEPGLEGPAGPQGPQGEPGPQGPAVDQASGIAVVEAGLRGVVVDAGVDIGAGSVIVVTPSANLRDRAFWVRKEDDADAFVIRISAPRTSDIQFSWLIVESN
jgi:hypothetical protein